MNETAPKPVINRKGLENPTNNIHVLSRFLVEWQMIVFISILGVGIIANILNHIVLYKGFSDTVLVRFIKCMSTIDAAFCVFRIIFITFKWWDYAHHRWLIEIYYYVVVYGRFSSEAIVTLMFVPLAIDRIKAPNRRNEKFAQKYQQSTKTKVVFNIVIAITVIIGLACSLPLFHVFKIRDAYYEGDSVYTVRYVKPAPKEPCLRRCMNIQSLIMDHINLETFYRVTRIGIPNGVLCMCLMIFIFKLPKIVGHYRYMKNECDGRNDQSNEECKSDLSLVPGVLINIVLFSILLCISAVFVYVRFERIIRPHRAVTVRKIVNMLLEMPVILACATKPFIYLVFSSRYRDTFGNLIKDVRFWANRSYEPQLGVNQEQGELTQRYKGTGSVAYKGNGKRKNDDDYGARRREEGKTAEGSKEQEAKF